MTSTSRRVAAGAAAGIAATIAMSVVMAGAKSVGLLGEPPPKKLTRRILTLVGLRPSGPGLYVATTAAHLAYGAGAGILYSLMPARARGPLSGGVFGAALWAASYIGWVPKLGLMRHPSRDRTGRPTAMILSHLVFGTALDLVLARSSRRNAVRRLTSASSKPST